MPDVIAFPSLALISAHDLAGSSLIEPSGTAEMKQGPSISHRIYAHDSCMLNRAVSRRENMLNPMP